TWDRAHPRNSFETRRSKRLLDRRDIFGIIELAQGKGRRCHIDDRDRSSSDKEAQLLEPFERLQLSHGRCHVALQRLRPISIDSDMKSHRRLFVVEYTCREVRDQPLRKIERIS